MFMDEDEFTSSPGFDYSQAFPSPDSKRQTENRNLTNFAREDNDYNDNLPSFGGGGSNAPSNGRARMLAQQRELQLKKRQSNMLGGKEETLYLALVHFAKHLD
jgi:hypothetical protein